MNWQHAIIGIVSVDDTTYCGRGTSKRDAREQAARVALNSLGGQQIVDESWINLNCCYELRNARQFGRTAIGWPGCRG